MKRSYERSTKLTAFKCDLSEFESLVDEVWASLDRETRRFSLSVTVLGGEQIEFDSFDEVRNSTTLPARINRLQVFLFESPRNRSWSFYTWTGSPRLHVNGDSAAWCAGMSERARDFAKRHRVWARPFIEWFSLIATGAMAFVSATPTGRALGWRWTSPQIIATAIILYLYLSRNRLFPAFAVELRKEETALTRHGPTIALVAGIISAAAAIVQLFLH